MGNIFQAYQVGTFYDLKGSTEGRTHLKPDQVPTDIVEKTALKDNDFIKHVEQITFVDES